MMLSGIPVCAKARAPVSPGRGLVLCYYPLQTSALPRWRAFFVVFQSSARWSTATVSQLLPLRFLQRLTRPGRPMVLAAKSGSASRMSRETVFASQALTQAKRIINGAEAA
jgi:hypothetical protein